MPNLANPLTAKRAELYSAPAPVATLAGFSCHGRPAMFLRCHRRLGREATRLPPLRRFSGQFFPRQLRQARYSLQYRNQLLVQRSNLSFQIPATLEDLKQSTFSKDEHSPTSRASLDIRDGHIQPD
jgi:hypothetical protein